MSFSASIAGGSQFFQTALIGQALRVIGALEARPRHFPKSTLPQLCTITTPNARPIITEPSYTIAQMDQFCEPSLFDDQRHRLRARVIAFPTRPHEPPRGTPTVVLSWSQSPKKEDTATLKRARESSPKKSPDEAIEKVVEVPETEADRVPVFDLGFVDI
jgi:hypothetical protein